MATIISIVSQGKLTLNNNGNILMQDGSNLGIELYSKLSNDSLCINSTDFFATGKLTLVFEEYDNYTHIIQDEGTAYE